MGPDRKGQVTPRSARSLTLAIADVGAGRTVSVSGTGRRSAITERTRWPLGLVVPRIVTPRHPGDGSFANKARQVATYLIM
jgi:hypothetical protein